MTRRDRTATVVVPGLLEAPPEAQLEPGDVPSAGTLLGRAAARICPTARGLEGALLSVFGAAPAPGELPVAAVTRLADSGQCDARWWLRADPVHLAPDRDRVVLFGPRSLGVEWAEARELVAALSAHFTDRGWVFEAPAPERWVLGLDTAPAVTHAPLADVVGQDIHGHLPGGAEAARWHGTLNEIQMLLHGHPVNARREQAGRPPINGVWFWGGGRLPAVESGRWARVWSGEPMSTGLARLARDEVSPVPVDANSWLQGAGAGAHLVVLDGLQAALESADLEAWIRTLLDLERHWLAPLHRALRRGAVRELALVPGDGRVYRLTRARLLKVWRWRRALPGGRWQ